VIFDLVIVEHPSSDSVAHFMCIDFVNLTCGKVKQIARADFALITVASFKIGKRLVPIAATSTPAWRRNPDAKR
jgi:hypothetical protein